jgi:hypothetical protein
VELLGGGGNLRKDLWRKDELFTIVRGARDIIFRLAGERILLKNC